MDVLSYTLYGKQLWNTSFHMAISHTIGSLARGTEMMKRQLAYALQHAYIVIGYCCCIHAHDHDSWM